MISCRLATIEDADPIAKVFSASFRMLAFLPILHTDQEDHIFIESILKDCEVIVAEDESGLVAFLARQNEEIRLLHTRPDRFRLGAATLLIEKVKANGAKRLELWCFQQNTPARRFYEKQGFRAVSFTDGENNEEKLPDTRYRWDSPI